MTSQINPNNIDGQYPVAGQPNNTQGFRDNFTNIKTNFQTAATEITDLENKGVFKAALTGTTLDNNMADNLIYAVKLQDVSYTYVQQTATAGAIPIDYAAGQYQLVAPTANVSLSFSNWPTAGSEGVVYVDVVVTNTAYTVTLPAAVSVGTTGIQGYSASVITFGATGTYRFGFSTADSGTTIAIYDLNRPLSYYTNAVNVAATTASTSTTSGALIVAGGVGVAGNLYVGGDIYGNVSITDLTIGNVSASGFISGTGNVTGGNLLSAGLASVTGNITGGNLRTVGLISATGTVTGSSHLGAVVSVTANVTGGNILTGGLVSATANVTGGNILTGGLISATSSVTSASSIKSSSQSAGVGYATGAGSTITQTVSRTQGVQIDRVSGAITLVSAAGTSAYNTFVVTNSTVSSSDVIILSQKSGTDKYNAFVTNVTNGTFSITFSDVSGTTTEQPVFNFAVIKAVAA